MFSVEHIAKLVASDFRFPKHSFNIAMRMPVYPIINIRDCNIIR